MARTRKFVKGIQDYLKEGDGMFPYMFPMIGKNYENAKKKIVVVAGYIWQDAKTEELLMPIYKKLNSLGQNIPGVGVEKLYKEINLQKQFLNDNPCCLKDDIIRHAWEHTRKGKQTPQSILKGRCNVDEIIFTSYSRCPSKETFRIGENQNDIFIPAVCRGGFFSDDKDAKNFLFDLIKCANPNEVWFLGDGTKRLVLDIPKTGNISQKKLKDIIGHTPGYTECLEQSENVLISKGFRKMSVDKRESMRESIYEKIAEYKFTQGKFKCVTIPIKEINEPKKTSRKIVVEKFSNKFGKRFNKFIQGKAFEKLDKDKQKACLNCFIERIQERIKQLDG